MHRRISRTDLDFEQALLTEGTVILKEGVDMNSLGLDTSPSPMRRDFGSPPPPPKENRTPKVVQPPAPAARSPTPTLPSSLKNPAPSPSSSSNELFFDAEDGEVSTKRRSLYRSPGTSSSPDLATLLRKAKERGENVNGLPKDEKRREVPPPLPAGNERAGQGMRQRSSTSSAQSPSIARAISAKHRPETSKSAQLSSDLSSNGGLEWKMASPLIRNQGSPVKVRTIIPVVRAFLPISDSQDYESKDHRIPGEDVGARHNSGTVGKVVTFQQRPFAQGFSQKTDASLSSAPTTPSRTTPPLFQAFTPPPVPPLPQNNLNKPRNDGFTNAQAIRDMAKPLPPIVRQSPEENVREDDRSLVMVEKPPARTPAPALETALRGRRQGVQANHVKRRSMSVGEFELKKAMETSSSTTPLPKAGEMHSKDDSTILDNSLNGIMTDFKGQLTQLDPHFVTSLDLKDPSTPSRSPGSARLKLETSFMPSRHLDNGLDTRSPKLSTPTVTVRTVLQEDIVPLSPASDAAPFMTPQIRPSTFPTPARSKTGPIAGSPRMAPPARHASSPMRPRHGNPFGGLAFPGSHAHSPSRESSRLRAQHRSTASSSEPSLIPLGDDPHGGKYQFTSVSPNIYIYMHRVFSSLHKLAARPH